MRPGEDQAIVAKGLRESIKATENHKLFNGTPLIKLSHPEGAVPVFEVKSHEPPVGVAGVPEEVVKINHSK